MAGTDRCQNRRVPGPARARAVAEGQSRECRPALYASGGEHSWPAAGFVPSQRVLAIMKGIADTGFLVAFISENDAYHDWAAGVAAQLDEPLLTCEAVLAETAFHLRNCAVVFQMLKEGIITLSFDCNDHLLQLEALAKRYSDRQPDLADLCLIRMSELFPKHSIVTVDREDFRVYRRNKRESIPLICPPGK